MIDPLIGLAGFLIGKAGYYVSKAFEDSAKSAVKKLWEDAGHEFGEGTLPPNHHLDRALQRSLGQTARFLAHCLHEPARKPILDLLEDFSGWPDCLHRVAEAAQGNLIARTPEDHWLAELIAATKKPDAFKDLDTRLAATSPARLTRERLDPELTRMIPEEFLKWTREHVTINPNRPATFDACVLRGWEFPPANPKADPPKPAGRITFYAVFCAFFREEVKRNEVVFRAFQTRLGTQLDEKLDHLLAAAPSPAAKVALRQEADQLRGLTPDQFEGHLGEANKNLLNLLLPEFAKLHGRHDRHDQDFAATPGKVADELERRRLVRPAFGFKADLSRIVKYAPAELIGREKETQLLDDAWSAALGVPPSGGQAAPDRLKPGLPTRPHVKLGCSP